jgi:hypothetical protein
MRRPAHFLRRDRLTLPPLMRTQKLRSNNPLLLRIRGDASVLRPDLYATGQAGLYGVFAILWIPRNKSGT